MLLTGQRYHRGDLIKVARNLGPSMKYFDSNCYAIIVGSYNDVCSAHANKDGKDTYEILLYPEKTFKSYTCSWYHESQLKLLETANGLTLGILHLYEQQRLG